MDIIRRLQEKGATLVAYKSSKNGNGPLIELIEINHDGIEWLISTTRYEDGHGIFTVAYVSSCKQIAEVYSVEDLVDLFN